MVTTGKIDKARADTQYRIQLALAGVDQIKSALEKIDFPSTIENAIVQEALELLRSNITSIQMLLLTISIKNLNRPNA